MWKASSKAVHKFIQSPLLSIRKEYGELCHFLIVEFCWLDHSKAKIIKSANIKLRTIVCFAIPSNKGTYLHPLSFCFIIICAAALKYHPNNLTWLTFLFFLILLNNWATLVRSFALWNCHYLLTSYVVACSQIALQTVIHQLILIPILIYGSFHSYVTLFLFYTFLSS